MDENPILFSKFRGLNSVKDLLRRSTPLLSANQPFYSGSIDLKADLLGLFTEQKTAKNAASYLTTIAATGHFTGTELNVFYDALDQAELGENKDLLYYLASLYLQLDELNKVDQIVESIGKPTAEMNWFAALMLYARKNGFDIPALSDSDRKCLDYLDDRLSNPLTVFQENLRADCTLAILGNAPGNGAEFDTFDEMICFNDYVKNPRLSRASDFHVVTPSWDIESAKGERHLFLTGNNIFHRRSRVWRRFGNNPQYQTVSCFPRTIWSRLYRQLEAPPSAGLLMIACCAELDLPENLALHVGGFSSGQLSVNHSYDRVTASVRHNWDSEALQRELCIAKLESRINVVRHP